MIWYKVNNRWCINMMEVQYFGAPKDNTSQITIKFKNGEETNFGVGEDKQMEVLNKMYKFVETINLQSMSTIIPDKGRLPRHWLD